DTSWRPLSSPPSGRCRPPLALRAAQATTRGGTRSRSLLFRLSRWRWHRGRPHSGTPLSVLSGAMGGSHPRRSHAGPHAALLALQDHAGVLRGRRDARDLASLPPSALRRGPRTLA